MPSTYTTNLGIEKIATGEQSGTWGTTTNTNLDLLDEAVNGIISITLSSAGSSGSPTALPITDGASSNGRNKFIEFVDGGDLGGTAYVQLTPNNAEKIVHIRNSLSGSRSVIVFQGTYNASNDFEIVSGADVLLKFNGGGSGATVTDVNVDLTVTGLTVTTANATTVNATTVDTTNLEVTNLKAKDGTAAGSIANSTGVVTIASAVLTTADINGGTADAVTIGGSTAAAGTFTAGVFTTAVASTETDTSNSGSITLDFSADQNFVLTLTGNVTLANPSTEIVGQSGFIVFIQDGTGSRTVSLGTDYETASGAGLTLSSAASTTDIVPYVVAASGRILLGAPQLAFS